MCVSCIALRRRGNRQKISGCYAPAHHDEPTGAEPRFPCLGLEHIGLTVDDIEAAVADLRA